MLIALRAQADADRQARRNAQSNGAAGPAIVSANDPDVGDMLSRSVRESESLLTARLDAVDFDLLCDAAEQLGTNYVANPPFSMLREGAAVRRELMRRKSHAMFRPKQLADFYVAIGRASGVIAYAALDLGDSASAAVHGVTVWQMAEVADDHDLRAWSRGTQSLIARFNHEFLTAQLFAEDGLRYARTPVSRSRLMRAAAQCAANQGDAVRTIKLIEDAERAIEASDYIDDNTRGIFGFPLVKQKFYSASSLVWMSDKRSLIEAAASATEALDTWRRAPDKNHMLDDEALAHVYLATAYMKLGEIEGVMEAVAPILELPLERRTSWMRKRVAGLREFLAEESYADSAPASIIRQRLYEFEIHSTRTAQIRIYDVRPDRLDEWIKMFHERIVPLRRELGFEIQGSWVDRERSQHIWVIAHDGESSFEEANAAYWASSKRAELDVDPDEFLTATETRTVNSTLP